MGWVWHDSASRVTSVEKNLLLQKGQTASLVFTPVLEGAVYTIDLVFDKTQKKPLDCYTIQASGIEWAITRDGKTIQAGSSTMPDVECDETDRAVMVRFLAPDLILNRHHALNLSIASKQQKEVKLQSRVSVKPFGVAVHYAFMDLAVQGLVLYVLLGVGFGCFLPDAYSFVFCGRFRKPSV